MSGRLRETRSARPSRTIRSATARVRIPPRAKTGTLTARLISAAFSDKIALFVFAPQARLDRASAGLGHPAANLDPIDAVILKKPGDLDGVTKG
jgi:hypothetical protein